MMNIKKRLQILALVAGISLSCVTQVKAELTWKHYLGAAGAAGLALMLKNYFSEAATLRREQSALWQEAKRLDILGANRQRKNFIRQSEDAQGRVVLARYAGIENPITGVNATLEREVAHRDTIDNQLRAIDGSARGRRLRAIANRSREIDRRLEELAAGR